jgi:hypothetical protein
MTLDSFKLLPIVAGDCPAELIEELLELFYGQDDTLIVIRQRTGMLQAISDRIFGNFY